MRIARQLIDELVAHAREDAPNECCGMIAARDGEAVRVYRARNAAASPLRYDIESEDVLRVTQDIDDAELDLGAIYHSHTRSAPYPSQTDVNYAFFPGRDEAMWPGAIYVIVGVGGDEPEVRAYRIPSRDRIEEVDLEVVDA
ncbi:MAG: M67 family metallopeptidase [Actinomycetota bacterium]|nr:M67 family metallopeptidase [Actinomycetota bacterium]